MRVHANCIQFSKVAYLLITVVARRFAENSGELEKATFLEGIAPVSGAREPWHAACDLASIQTTDSAARRAIEKKEKEVIAEVKNR